MKSAKSKNPGRSVIQTSYDMVKAKGRLPIDIGMKVETPPAGRAGKEGQWTEFIIRLSNV